jgi:hypothetical protein
MLTHTRIKAYIVLRGDKTRYTWKLDEYGNLLDRLPRKARRLPPSDTDVAARRPRVARIVSDRTAEELQPMSSADQAAVPAEEPELQQLGGFWSDDDRPFDDGN